MKYKKFIVLFLTMCITIITAVSIFASGQVVFAAKEKSAETVDVPIIMYHSILDSNTSDWGLAVSELETDMKYLKDNGYETVLITDLLAFVNEECELPEKPIVLTFDDGYYNNYTKVYPLLEKYDMNMVLSVIGTHSDIWSNELSNNESCGHCTWDELKEMSESGRVELANHTWDLHNNDNRYGCSQMAGENLESYAKTLADDLERLQLKLEELDGKRPICFTYPYGKKSSSTVDIAKQIGFDATLSVQGGINKIKKGDKECLYDMLRNNRSPSEPVSRILEKIA